MTLTLCRLFRQDMIPEGLTVLITFGSFFEPLGRTTTGFQFWHDLNSALFSLMAASFTFFCSSQ
jgi:hypothetical protein